ncbi:Maf1-domain-containing protein [Pseudovirgaria hyperparasitica]|uniref:AP-1 complex subunit sigma-1 n=1 Tax=Pseudovirgaria hyperparasitica TaxID=470096 RepID=A0A6A6WAM9_9PEZI|nr:Maf1-domain-containing protein [Pseudovirgaria hyperparasitica]KAF2759010.1 Maf1-domain-containing protein [Pseudovirgaria hyperparasitica]
MAIKYLILLSRQGKVRLAKWFTTLSPKDKAKIIKDVSQLVLARRTRMCNFLEYKDTKIVYRRYASLFFIAGCDSTDNELITLEIVHRYVEQMDKYYGNVCELDIIFNFQKAYFILDELLLAGEMQESSKKNVLRCIAQQDSLEDMEYLPLRDFEDVTSALNFTTPDCHVVGGCDLYTTKAAGSDKKLYKSIENTLETQHASLLRLSASLSPPQQESLADSLNLSRSSPFGPLSQISSRRTFAYLIATLNASHPDYDFSHVLRPADFRRERSLRGVMHTLDTTLSNLRPSTLVSSPSSWSSGPIPSGLRTPGGSTTWGPRMWRLIDAEMDLRKCSVYAYAPEEDPFDGDEGAVWRMDYFFFNKERKRVCYMYLRGLSVISHSPVLRPMGTPKRTRSGMGGMSEPTTPMTSGARKRARYWLGERADGDDVEGGWGEDDEDAGIIAEPGDDEVDVDDITLDLRDVEVERRRAMSMAVSSDEEEDAEDEDEEDDLDVVRQEQKQHRAMSETMADEMEF